jgi:transcription antitermination factor NusG
MKPKFSFTTKVKIIDGFYKNFKGIIKSFSQSNDIYIYDVLIKLDNNEKLIKFKEEQLEEISKKPWYSFS